MFIIKTIITSAASLIFLFIVAKLLGRRQISELSVFDYINGITIGSIAAELATCEWTDFVDPLIAMAIYGGLTLLISIITEKSKKARKFFTGEPVILMSDGKLYRDNFKRTHLDINEFSVLCRNAGYFDISKIGVAIIEPNGKLSILPLRADMTLTPGDMQIPVKPQEIPFGVIMDGQISDQGLAKAQKSREWLRSELLANGYQNADSVFYASCTPSGTLHIYANQSTSS